MSRVINQGVVVTVTIKNGKQASDEVESIGRRGQSAFSGWSSTLGTIQKALLSMVGVITAWTILITIPEKLAAAFKDLAIASVEAAAEMEKTFVSTAGILASSENFGGKNFAENFSIAYVQSEKLYLKFQEISASSLGTADQLLLAYRTLVAEGGMAFVKNQEDAVRVTKVLVDTIYALNGGQNVERSINSDIAQLMQGTARTGNLMGKIIQERVGDLKQWVTHLRGSKDLAEQLEQIFGGMVAASPALANTFEGVLNSIKGQLNIFNTFANRAGALRDVLDWLKGIRDLLQNAIHDLDQLSDKSHVLSLNTLDILHIFGYLNAAIQQTLAMFEYLITAFTGQNTQLQQAVSLAESLAVTMTVIRTIVEWMADEFGFIVDSVRIFTDALAVGALRIENLIRHPLSHAAQGDAATAVTAALDASAKQLLATIDKLRNKPGFGDALDINLQTMRDQMRLTTASIEAEFAKIASAGENAGKAVETIIAPTKEQLSYMEKLNREYEKAASEFLQRGGDIFAETFSKANVEIDEMSEKLKGQKALMEDAGSLIVAIAMLGFQKDLNKYLEEYQKLREKDFQEDAKGEEAIMKIGNAQRVLNALYAAGRRPLKDMIADTQILVDNSQGLGEHLKEVMDSMSHGDLSGFQRLPAIFASMGAQIEENNKQIDEWNHRQTFSAEEAAKVAEQVDKLRKANVGLNHELHDAAEHMRGILTQSIQLGDVFTDIAIRIVVMGQSIKQAFSAELPNILMALGQGLQNFVAGLIDGANKGVPVWKRALAAILSTLAEMAAAMASFVLAAQFVVPGFGGGFAGAFALYAAAGVLAGLAAKLGSGSSGNVSASAGSGSSNGASSGNRIIYINPTSGTQGELLATLRGVKDAVNGLSTQPPGVVVKAAANDPGTMKVVTKAIDNTLQGSSTAAISFRKTVFGES